MKEYYDFRIDAWKPETLPMARLAEYLAKLAVLFGNKEHVHFSKVRKGSAIPEIYVDEHAIPKVNARLRLVGAVEAPDDIGQANREINRMLRSDNAIATLKFKGGAKILEFPGRKTPLAEEAIVHQLGELDGVVIRVGGKDKSVPLHLQGENGVYYTCNTTRDIARQLATYLFGQTVRVAGRGKWRRTQDGLWELEDFDVKSFELLDDANLEDVLADMRKVEDSDWNLQDNPQRKLKTLRYE
ncbi:MAG: hypothetical protein ABL920_10040 [Methylotenera sp.]